LRRICTNAPAMPRSPIVPMMAVKTIAIPSTPEAQLKSHH
jgi:hypothetical protein